MSPILEYNYEEVECMTMTKPNVNNTNSSNAVIVLQPSFPLLQQKPKQSSVSSLGEESASDAPPPQLKLSSIEPNDIWHMWSVATKAKASIPQGYRLENLSWRLWHRYICNPNHAYASNLNLIGPGDLLNQTNQALKASSSSVESSQSTDSEFTPSLSLIHTASAILTEIQQNNINNSNARAFPSNTSVLSLSPPQSETTPFCPKKESGTTIISSSPSHYSPSQQQHLQQLQQQQSDGSEMGTSSTTSKSSSGGKGSRRKKNVQRFMQRYQNRLADISERITQSEASESEDFCPGSSEREQPPSHDIIINRKGSTEPIDVSGDSPALSKPSKAHSDETYFKMGEMKRTTTASSDPQKPKISLLTRLLDHNHNQVHRPSGEDSFNPMSELRFRRESGTPLGQTPPARPSAPVIFSNNNAATHHEDSNSIEENRLIGRSIVMSKKGKNALLDEDQRRLSMDSNEGDFTSMMLW